MPSRTATKAKKNTKVNPDEVTHDDTDNQDKFQRFRNDLKRELENVLGLQVQDEAKLADLQEEFKIQRERIMTVFNKVQQFLEKEKCRHLSILEEEEKITLQKFSKKVSEMVKQQASLRDQITELEAKCRQPDVELLKDLKSIISRLEKVSGPVKETQKKTEQIEEEEDLFEEEAEEEWEEEEELIEEEELEEDEKDEDKVEKEELELKIIETLKWRWACSYAGEVTLDPGTANVWLALSEDGRSVSHGDRAQNLPTTTERYTPVIALLGRERLCSGRFYWEVEVGDKTAWDLGVCNESASRKGMGAVCPETGYWMVQLRDGPYKALTTPVTPLSPSVPPRVVGMFLDYEEGRFSVYNVTDRSLLFTFPRTTFPKTLRPYFCPELRDGAHNAGALRVLTQVVTLKQL